MKILLRSDVEKLGRRGDICEVADGYARNYLVPRGIAVKAEKGVLKQAESMLRARAIKDAKTREEANELASRLGAASISISARAADEVREGESRRLFGSVSASEIASAIEAAVGVEIDRRKLVIAEPIKTVGSHSVSIRIHPEVIAEVTVEVTAE